MIESQIRHIGRGWRRGNLIDRRRLHMRDACPFSHHDPENCLVRRIASASHSGTTATQTPRFALVLQHLVSSPQAAKIALRAHNTHDFGIVEFAERPLLHYKTDAVLTMRPPKRMANIDARPSVVTFQKTFRRLSLFGRQINLPAKLLWHGPCPVDLSPVMYLSFSFMRC